ncbi:MAG: MraY family glycosyltransferase [Patescibacteria group bacterium]
MLELLSLNWVGLSFYLFSVLIISFLLTYGINRIAKKLNITDDPKSALFRKFQKFPIPLLGGSGGVITSLIFMSILWIGVKYDFYNLTVLNTNLNPFKLVYLIVSILILIFVGYLDDKYQLSPKYQFIGILLAIFITIFLGNIRIASLLILPEFSFATSILITIIWLGFCTASTKFLDGHDGLVTSVGIFNFLTVANISLLPYINQPLIFLFSLTWAISLIPTLFFNFPNAKSYIGEGASEVIGFAIGTLAIISGAKVATALSILGWFILDIFLVWSIRLSQGRNPITSSDRNHWHHRLINLGLNKIQVLVFTWILLTVSSYVGVYGDTQQKIILLVTQFFLLIAIYILTNQIYKKKE